MLHRRTVLKLAVLMGAALAAPGLALAATRPVALVTKAGRKVAGALALPSKTPAGAVLLIHDQWGLDQRIKDIAELVARSGYIGLAVDLFDGELPDSPDAARAAVHGLRPSEAGDKLSAAVDWLRAHPKGNGRVASIGWSFGGGWSLAAALIAPLDAAVVYYGFVGKTAAELRKLQGPVLGHFAIHDPFIDTAMTEGYAKEMAEAGKRLEIYHYAAQHGFAHPADERYDEANAKLAWRRTLAFLKRNLAPTI
jgi:carboxymethylenebutenolidase